MLFDDNYMCCDICDICRADTDLKIYLELTCIDVSHHSSCITFIPGIYSIIILHYSSLATLIHANTLVSESCYSPKYRWITMLSYMLWLSATRFLSWDVIWFWIGLCILNIHVSPDLAWGHNLSHSRTDTAQNRFTTIFCSNHPKTLIMRAKRAYDVTTTMTSSSPTSVATGNIRKSSWDFCIL